MHQTERNDIGELKPALLWIQNETHLETGTLAIAAPSARSPYLPTLIFVTSAPSIRHLRK
jgi:hypothetical protein